jgi:hypothetical protein
LLYLILSCIAPAPNDLAAIAAAAAAAAHSSRRSVRPPIVVMQRHPWNPIDPMLHHQLVHIIAIAATWA